MRILFIDENLGYGGAARKLIELANAMVKRGMDVTLYVYNGGIENKEKLDKAICCIIEHTIKKSDNWFYRNTVYRAKCINQINRFLEKNHYDVIISFKDMVNLSILLCGAAQKSKIIISERGDPNYNKKYLQIIKKFLFRKADGIVFQTEGAQQFYGEKIKKKSIIIPNSIPMNYKYKRYTGEREKKIVSVARLWLYQKRQDVLIHAFNKITNRYPDYSLVLYGDGPDENVLRKLVMELGLESKVTFAGVTKNVFESIRKASLFVLSSDFEGIPNALIEAMVLGLPVVSTDCSPGGARLLIDNYVNGILVAPSDVRELALAMEYMINNPDTATKMGNNAMKIADKFNEKKIYDTWEEYIKNIEKV